VLTLTRSTHLILIRHGHTAANGGEGDSMRLSGWTDVPLSPLGHRQAELAGRQLGVEEPIAALYASPLQRARDTAAYVQRATGAPLTLEAGLREIGCGAADGRTVEEVREAFPLAWERNARQDDDDFRWPGGGESYRDFRARSLAAISGIADRHPGQRVAIVTHTGVITQVLGALEGRAPAEWQACRAGNCSITRLEWRRGRARLLAFDDREHLAPLHGLQTTTRRPLAG
jgi:broad specificity phosphatase PhoE